MIDERIAAGIVPCIRLELRLSASAVGLPASADNALQFGVVPIAPGSVASGAIVPNEKVLAKL